MSRLSNTDTNSLKKSVLLFDILFILNANSLEEINKDILSIYLTFILFSSERFTTIKNMIYTYGIRKMVALVKKLIWVV